MSPEGSAKSSSNIDCRRSVPFYFNVIGFLSVLGIPPPPLPPLFHPLTLHISLLSYNCIPVMSFLLSILVQNVVVRDAYVDACSAGALPIELAADGILDPLQGVGLNL